VLDEPTTGLHLADISLLMRVLWRLREQGNTLILIEHHLDVIRSADWVLDLGPGGGEHGGELIAAGPPALLSQHATSPTGRFLRPAESSLKAAL
jgi:excinuclease ABC subunit A